MTRILISVVLLSVIDCIGARAEWVDASCRVLTKLVQKPQDGEDLNGWMIRVCDEGDRRLYWALSRPERGRYGICRYQATFIKPKRFIKRSDGDEPVFTDVGEAGSGVWVYSSDYMMPSINCPPQTDARYIRADGITDGVFASLTATWDRIRSSEAAFDAAFAEVTLDEIYRSRFELFKRISLDRKQPQGPKITSISVFPPYVPNRESPAFDVEFEHPSDRSEWFTVSFDLGKRGFEIIGFRIVIA